MGSARPGFAKLPIDTTVPAGLHPNDSSTPWTNESTGPCRAVGSNDSASRLLADVGIDTVDEYSIHDGQRLLAQLDLAIPALRIGIECQSWKWHATPEAQRRDAARKRCLRRLGWEILDLWWSDLDRIDDVIATLAIIVAERRSC